MNSEALFVINVCDPVTGWKKPVVYTESKQEEMNKFITQEELARNFVSTTWIHAASAASLREYFLNGEHNV
jgi:hypothetical protein